MRMKVKVWHRKQRYLIRQRPVLNTCYRVGVGVIGTLLVVAGMVMIPLPIPGPGWITFFLGLSVLSTEFAWAHRVTSYAHRMLRRAGEFGRTVYANVRTQVSQAIAYHSQTLGHHLSDHHWAFRVPGLATA